MPNLPKNTPRVLVMRAPGTNCDHETAFAFELAGAKGRKEHDKRQALREKDDKREVAKAVGRRSKGVE